MSKQLLLNFNQDGSLSQSQSTGSAIRQGDSNGEVTLVATFQNRRNDAYVAKLHFERPDGKKQRNIVMMPSASQSNQFDYSFLSGWFFAVAGTAKVTVTITDSNGAVSAQGSYSFAVEPTQVDVVDSTISYDEAAELEGLIAKLAIGYIELPSYDPDGYLDDDQAEEARKTVCLIKRGNDIFIFSREYEGTKYFESIPVMRVTGYKQGWITIGGLDSNSPTWEYVSEDYDMDSAPTQNSTNLITSGGVHSAIATKADLVEGKVPAAQLPSYVDDAVEGYFFNGAFYADASHTELIAGERSKIYVDLDTNLTYRWTGSAYVRVNEAVSNVGYIVIDDENEDENGSLTAAQVTEANKDVCFIQYTNGEGTMMLVSYHFSGTERYFWSLMTNTLEIGEPDGSPWAYRFRQARIILWDIDDPTSATWQFNEDDDVEVTHEAERSSMDLITSHGVYNAVSALDAKILAVDDKVNYAIEAITKKDLYETQEATFQGMTAVPAGAMGKAYLAGFKGNSAVVNQLVPDITSGVTNQGVQGTVSFSNHRVTLTCSATQTGLLQLYKSFSNSQLPLIEGHTYLQCARVFSSKAMQIKLRVYQNLDGATFSLSANTAQFCSYIGVARNYTGTKEVGIVGVGSDYVLESGDTVYFENMMLIDLTQAGLTSAQMADAATAKAALKHKGMDVDSYIPFNAGTLTDSKPTKLYSRNAILASLPLKKIGAVRVGDLTWQYQSGNKRFVSSAVSGMKIVTDQSIVQNIYAQGYTSVKQYDVNGDGYNLVISTYNGLVMLTNTAYNDAVAFKTANADLVIYYELATPSSTISQAVIDGLVEHEYDLTMPTLKSAGSVQDESKAGGSKVKTLDLSVSRFVTASYGYILPNRVDGMKYNAVSDYVSIANILASKYTNASYNDVSQGRTSDAIAIGTEAYPYILVSDTSAPSGNMNYELATPTDFTDLISYPEIFDVYAGGSVEVVGDGCDATTKVYFYVEA